MKREATSTKWSISAVGFGSAFRNQFRHARLAPKAKRAMCGQPERSRSSATVKNGLAAFCSGGWVEWHTLVVRGGIGENGPAVRVRVCDGRDSLGIDWKTSETLQTRGVKPFPRSQPGCGPRYSHGRRLMIAKTVCQVLGLGGKRKEGELNMTPDTHNGAARPQGPKGRREGIT